MPRIRGFAFAVDGAHELRAPSGCGGVTAKFLEELPKPGTTAAPAKKPTNEQLIGRLMLAIAAVMVAARIVRAAVGASASRR